MKSILIFTILFFPLFKINQQPKDIVGKWSVEKIDIPKSFTEKMSQQQKEVITNSFIKPLFNATFDFKPDHHFNLSPSIGNMPKNDSWEYKPNDGIIMIREFNNPQSSLMKIKVDTKDGNVFFTMQGSPIILKMRKQTN